MIERSVVLPARGRPVERILNSDAEFTNDAWLPTMHAL